MIPAIIYEDEDIIIMNKPTGFSVHQTSTSDTRVSLVSFLLAHYPALKTIGENPLRPGIVHRLDKETSGLMVIAKNNETFYELKRQFQERKVEKKYIALVSGIVKRDHGIIDMSLIKTGSRTLVSKSQSASWRTNPKQTSNTKHKLNTIRTAITEYKVIKRFNEYTLVEVIPKTGRMHQIRVHFASINHPIACDKLYGRKAKKCPVGLTRHFLHAAYLRFRLKNALMEFEVELPEDLKIALKGLQ